MSNRNQHNTEDYDNDFSFAVPTSPRSQRIKTNATSKAGRTAKYKKGLSHRKGNTKGGIHQRGNKRMSW